MSSETRQCWWSGVPGVPVSRADIVTAAATKYPGSVKFTGSEQVDGKKYNSNKIRSALGWAPRYKSFAEFMKSESQVFISMYVSCLSEYTFDQFTMTLDKHHTCGT